MERTLGSIMHEVFEVVKAAREKRLTAAALSGKPAEEDEELLEWLKATDKALTFIAKYAVWEEIAESERAAAAAAQ